MWKVLTNISTLAFFIRKFRIFSYARDIDLTGDVAPFPAPTTGDTAGLPFSCHKSVVNIKQIVRKNLYLLFLD